MTTQAVANRLVELCRAGKWNEAQDELYAANAVSIEPEGANMPKAEGMEAIKAKGEQWASMVEEVHSGEVSDPIVAGNHFSCTMITEATFKNMGRQKLEEVAVYEVQNGKIVKEQFFYPTMN